MTTLRYTLTPLTAFGTPISGDTLFGQLCWTLRNQLGDDRLRSLLSDYTDGMPFAVVSDAFPKGHLPLPAVPSGAWANPGNLDRKTLKKKRWVPVEALSNRSSTWQSLALSDQDLISAKEAAQPHNSINRSTGTTGTGAFAPYTTEQIWFKPGSQFDLYVVLDEAKLSINELSAALELIGHTGYGRDASIGLGKFQLDSTPEPIKWHVSAASNSYLTLAPCAPQGQGFCAVRSTWQVMTRFGRHGDVAVAMGNPFKKPILLSQTGALFWPENIDLTCRHIGQGVGGRTTPISFVMPDTVHQGYAPVIPIERPTEIAV